MPMGKYESFAACVAQNKDRENPEAYCGALKKKVEGEEINVINEVIMSLGEVDASGTIRGAQLMPIGKWNHPLGDIVVTPERARSFAEQFKRNVTGQRLPVYWIHSDKANVSNPNYGKAAGWFTDIRADDQMGVLVDIEFTEAGLESVKKKEFQYLSAEFFDKVQLAHHNAPQEDVIMAASLVNRPHLKGMVPILNEETGHQFMLGAANMPIEGESPMDPILRQLCEQAEITLSEDQSELTEEQRTALTEFLTKRDKDLSDTVTKVDLLEKQLADKEDPDKAKMKSLAEAGFEEEAKLLSDYRADRMVKELSEFAPEGKILAPATEQVARAYALEQTPENLKKLHEAMLKPTAVVDLRELGHSGENEDDDTSDTIATTILEEASKIAVEKQISLGEAMSEYSREHPEKWNEYQKSVGANFATIGGN